MRSGRGAPVGGTSGAPASPSEGSGESSGKLSTGRRFPAIEQWLGFPSGAHRRFIAGSIFRGSGGVAEAEKSITWSPDARAAILRDESGAIVGTTWGGAQCWFPRRSKRGDRFALIDGAGAETIARCRWCPGCLRYDSQQLGRRLVEHFKDFSGEIWIILVRAAYRNHGAVADSLYRSRKVSVERAFYRLGTDHLAFIARGKKPRPPRMSGRADSIRVFKVKRSRGRRAWAIVTAGLLVNREEYGAWRNRFYHRGLKPLPADRKWEFSASFAPGLSAAASRSFGVRAFAAGTSIHFPKAIALPHLRNRARRQMRRVSDAQAIDDIVASIFQRDAGLTSLLPPRRAQRAAASTVSGLRIARTTTAAGAAGDETQAVARVPSILRTRSLSSTKGAGYQGSLQLSDRGRPDFSAWAERMRALARARGDPPDKKG